MTTPFQNEVVAPIGATARQRQTKSLDTLRPGTLPTPDRVQHEGLDWFGDETV